MSLQQLAIAVSRWFLPPKIIESLRRKQHDDIRDSGPCSGVLYKVK
jgi:hypothetical protein